MTQLENTASNLIKIQCKGKSYPYQLEYSVCINKYIRFIDHYDQMSIRFYDSGRKLKVISDDYNKAHPVLHFFGLNSEASYYVGFFNGAAIKSCKTAESISLAAIEICYKSDHANEFKKVTLTDIDIFDDFVNMFPSGKTYKMDSSSIFTEEL